MKKLFTMILMTCFMIITSQVYGQQSASKGLGGKTRTKTEKVNKSSGSMTEKNVGNKVKPREQKEYEQKSDSIQKGNAYGKNKGTMTGKEFGKTRSTSRSLGWKNRRK